MALPVSVLPAGIVAAGAPATAKITVNTRVSTPAGAVGIITDIMQFPGPAAIGNWLAGATRVLVNGVPVVNQDSVGTSFSPTSVPTGPMVVTLGDPRVSAL